MSYINDIMLIITRTYDEFPKIKKNIVTIK